MLALVGLPYVEPELRENRGEIEATLERRLPRLLKQGDIRGDLRVHSSVGGETGLRRLAEAALARGYEYVAVADRISRGHGLSARRDSASSSTRSNA